MSSDVPVFVSDTMVDLEKDAIEKPVLFEDKPLELEDSVAGIPEVQACVTLMREAMRELRKRKDLSPFIRKQKLKNLQLDYLKLGGRLKALTKLLAALDANPDYYEVQEDVTDCVKALALLIQDFEKRYGLGVAAWCREHFPLTPEQEAERNAYEDTLLAKSKAVEEHLADTEMSDDSSVPAHNYADAEIFAHADEVEGLCGEYMAAPDPAQDRSNEPIDLDV